MQEYERSYIFSYDDGEYVISRYSNSGDCQIEDYYFNKCVRARCVDGSIYLTKKDGDKTTGRVEVEEPISRGAFEILRSSSCHIVKKHRYTLTPDTFGRWKDYKVTMDLVSSPLKIAVLEIESADETPVPADITYQLFARHFRECPLSSWDFFKRKIGICGTSGAGKSETAKWVSHYINTRLNGNAFHVAEYATTFIQKYRRNPTFQDQFFLWYGQKSREQDASTADIVISDCPTFLNFIYMQLLNNEVLNDRTAMYFSKIYKRVLSEIKSYSDVIFLQLQDYKYNNVRYQTPEQALDIQNRIDRFLTDHGVPHKKTTYHDKQIIADLFYINDWVSV